MKKLFFFAALFMLAATSCDSVANTPNDADNESRVTEDIMDMTFYNDGTCRLGYTSSVYSNCEERLKDIENHPRGLYDTWQWSCNFEIQGAEARAEFEKVYFNEEDYPCCAQYKRDFFYFIAHF